MKLLPTSCVGPSCVEHIFGPRFDPTLLQSEVDDEIWNDEQLVPFRQASLAISKPQVHEDWSGGSQGFENTPIRSSDCWYAASGDSLDQIAFLTSNGEETSYCRGYESTWPIVDKTVSEFEVNTGEEITQTSVLLDTANNVEGGVSDELYCDSFRYWCNEIDRHTAPTILDAVDVLRRSSHPSTYHQHDWPPEEDIETTAVLRKSTFEYGCVLERDKSPATVVADSRCAGNAQQHELPAPNDSLDAGLRFYESVEEQADGQHTLCENSAISLLKQSYARDSPNSCHWVGEASDIRHGDLIIESAPAPMAREDEFQGRTCYDTTSELVSHYEKQNGGMAFGGDRSSAPWCDLRKSKKRRRLPSIQREPPKRRRLNHDIFLRVETIRLPVLYDIDKDKTDSGGDMAVFHWKRRSECWATNYNGEEYQFTELYIEETYKYVVFEVRPNGGDLPVKLAWDMDSQTFKGLTLDNKVISMAGTWSEIQRIQLNPENGQFLGRSLRQVTSR